MFENLKIYVNGRRDSELENTVTNKLSNDENLIALCNAFNHYREMCAKFDNEKEES